MPGSGQRLAAWPSEVPRMGGCASPSPEEQSQRGTRGRREWGEKAGQRTRAGSLQAHGRVGRQTMDPSPVFFGCLTIRGCTGMSSASLARRAASCRTRSHAASKGGGKFAQTRRKSPPRPPKKRMVAAKLIKSSKPGRDDKEKEAAGWRKPLPSPFPFHFPHCLPRRHRPAIPKPPVPPMVLEKLPLAFDTVKF